MVVMDLCVVSTCDRFVPCLFRPGRATLLTSELIRKTLGTSILEPSNDHRLIAWLAQQEDQHQVRWDCSLVSWSAGGTAPPTIPLPNLRSVVSETILC